jgi:predicted nucleic acid-binding protein
MADGLITATALEHDLIVVTRNTKDFADLGVALLNPWEE